MKSLPNNFSVKHLYLYFMNCTDFLEFVYYFKVENFNCVKTKFLLGFENVCC